jgi:hypothetical protein
VAGSIVCYQATQPGHSLRTLGTADWNLSFWAIALTLNMLLSGLIVGRLWRARASAALGHGRAYAGLSAIVIESAAPYAAVAFAWLVMYGTDSIGAFLLLQVLVQIEVRLDIFDICLLSNNHTGHRP